MLKLLSPVEISKSPYRAKLDKAGIKGGWNYALDHAWLFERIHAYQEKYSQSLPIILDVGCGDGMLHPYLEQELGLGIIGIDRITGSCPANGRNFRMDICIDFVENNTFFNNSVDIVYWCSAIEHNPPEKQKILMQASMKALKPGGIFLATFGHSKESGYFAPSQQWNLSLKDAEFVFEDKWSGETDYNKLVSEYRQNFFDIDSRHNKRYNTDEYDFVVAAIEKTKQ